MSNENWSGLDCATRSCEPLRFDCGVVRVRNPARNAERISDVWRQFIRDDRRQMRRLLLQMPLTQSPARTPAVRCRLSRHLTRYYRFISSSQIAGDRGDRQWPGQPRQLYCSPHPTAHTSSHWNEAVTVHFFTSNINSFNLNHLGFIDNYSATSNNMSLIHWPLMGGLLHLVRRRGDWARPQPAQAPPRCTKCKLTAHPSTANVPITY